jgi:hypothetical protein
LSRASGPPQRRRRAAADEPLLFDLPLSPPERGPARSARGGRVEPAQPELFPEPSRPFEREAVEDEERSARHPAPVDVEEVDEAPAGPVIAGLGARLLAGCADALLHLGVLAGVYLGLLALDVEPRLGHWPAFATLLLAFSFLSSVVSLAFWGQTAGMAWRGLLSRDRLQRPLTFRQAMLRWAGGLVTFAAAGVPLLLALGGSSLSDWLSRSVTLQAAASAAPRRLP